MRMRSINLAANFRRFADWVFGLLAKKHAVIRRTSLYVCSRDLTHAIFAFILEQGNESNGNLLLHAHRLVQHNARLCGKHVNIKDDIKT
jgi:hypothetical protein